VGSPYCSRQCTVEALACRPNDLCGEIPTRPRAL
jgi:hypothetical protein